MTSRAKSPTHQTWLSMMRRCYGRSDNARYYSGRGIYVAEEWHHFDQFLMDMGERPAGMTLDRIDGNGPYCKENCRWASVIEQARNKSNNHIITSTTGESRCLTEWAEVIGVDRDTIRRRIAKGWPLDKILRTTDDKSHITGRRKST